MNTPTLKTAQWLSNYLSSPSSILISDPYTLRIFEAITGNNGAYTFSNLGLMKKEEEQKFKSLFQHFIPNSQNKNISSDYDKTKSENWYNSLMVFIYRSIGNEAIYALSYNKILTNEFDLKTNRKNFIWIISEKTVQWAYGDVGYYPQNQPFSESYIRKYIEPHFDTLYNFDNRILVLRLK